MTTEELIAALTNIKVWEPRPFVIQPIDAAVAFILAHPDEAFIRKITGAPVGGLHPATVDKMFDPPMISAGGNSTLIITLTNPNPVDLTGVAFTDTYPRDMTNSATPAATTTDATGTVVAEPGATSVSLKLGTIPANGSIKVTVQVTAIGGGSYSNSIAAGSVTTINGSPNAAPASATLTVTPDVPADAPVVGDGTKSKK